MKTKTPMRRLPLEGTQNTRDLGGYPCEGGVTRWGCYLRSDNPENLTLHDMDFLLGYGVDTAVDLRRADEASRAPSRLATHPKFTVHNISINNHFHNVDFEGDLPGSMSGLYIKLLDQSKNEIRQVMQAIADAKGGVVFHCAVGKDRTGVVSMLLLRLAGVEESDVIADYSVTDIYLNDIYEKQSEVFKNGFPEYVLRSKPASMERVLRHLRETYGNARAYMEECGLSPDTVQQLKNRFVEPNR